MLNYKRSLIVRDIDDICSVILKLKMFIDNFDIDL